MACSGPSMAVTMPSELVSTRSGVGRSADELEPEAVHGLQDPHQVGLVPDAPDQGAGVLAWLDAHAFEARREPLRDPSSDDDPVDDRPIARMSSDRRHAVSLAPGHVARPALCPESPGG